MMAFYGHPFSSYCQKVLIALYERDVEFEWRILDQGHPEHGAQFAALWPIGRFPLLKEDDRCVFESSAIIDYLDLHHGDAAPMVPGAPEQALDVRMLDRFFDHYIHTPMQKIVFDALREPTHRDRYGVDEARALLDRSYAWLDGWMDGRTWAVGERFGLADCAAAPALFYADWVHAIPDQWAHVKTYRRHLLARPSFARAVDEARSYRHLFPLGAPDRD